MINSVADIIVEYDLILERGHQMGPFMDEGEIKSYMIELLNEVYKAIKDGKIVDKG